MEKEGEKGEDWRNRGEGKDCRGVVRGIKIAAFLRQWDK
jgi:hypothetical protein